jgi:hypothetical protein
MDLRALATNPIDGTVVSNTDASGGPVNRSPHPNGMHGLTSARACCGPHSANRRKPVDWWAILKAKPRRAIELQVRQRPDLQLVASAHFACFHAGFSTDPPTRLIA